MSIKKTDRRARVFAVLGDLGKGDDVALHEVLTWAKLSDAEAFCGKDVAGISKRVIIAERGGSFEGAMSMTVGESGVWSVKLEHDRGVSPLKDGQVLSVLESDWTSIGRGGLWQLRANVIGHIRRTSEGARFVPHGLSL